MPNRIYQTAQHLVVVGGLATFLFFAPFPRAANLLKPIPLGIASSITACVASASEYFFYETQRAAYYGVGIHLPPHPPWSILWFMYLIILFLFILTICVLLARPGHEQGTGLGLYLISASGFHLQEPYQLMVILIGIMQIIRYSLEKSPKQHQQRESQGKFPTTEQWTHYFSRLAHTLADPAESGEVVQLHNENHQIAQIRGNRRGLPFSLRIQYSSQGIKEFEATVGQPSQEIAPVSLERRRGSRGKNVTEPGMGSPCKLGPKTLDQQFVLLDSTACATSWFRDPNYQTKLQQNIHGWLGLWPGKGVRYVSRPSKDGWPLPVSEVARSTDEGTTANVESLLQLLEELARQVNIPANP
jgi:hypothetical protein